MALLTAGSIVRRSEKCGTQSCRCPEKAADPEVMGTSSPARTAHLLFRGWEIEAVYLLRGPRPGAIIYGPGLSQAPIL